MLFGLILFAPRFFWSEFDTYRAGVTKQSESTMHTLGVRRLRNEDFEYPLKDLVLNSINDDIDLYNEDGMTLEKLKNNLPEGFLQRRIVCTNYKTLRNMILQRKKHELSQWRLFISQVISQVEHPELLPGLE